MNEFNSLEQLYYRLTPALNSKVDEIKIKGHNYVKQIDIWNYLSNNEWNNKKDLSLYEMVDDILNADDKEINNYLLNILNTQERNLDFLDEGIL